jgi:hypothetical protein
MRETARARADDLNQLTLKVGLEGRRAVDPGPAVHAVLESFSVETPLLEQLRGVGGEHARSTDSDDLAVFRQVGKHLGCRAGIVFQLLVDIDVLTSRNVPLLEVSLLAYIDEREVVVSSLESLCNGFRPNL